MKLIKLNAIDSTNTFLKALSNNQLLDNFTVVTAENQTQGKGQMGSVWTSEPSKNLIMSIFIKNFIPNSAKIFDLNIAVSIAIIKAIEVFNIPGLSIKWPNDIMSYTKKIGGILIENSIKSEGDIYSIVGLGLNVNQINFENLPRATSLAVLCNKTLDKEAILTEIVNTLETYTQIWNENSDFLRSEYNNKLFKKGVPTPFSNQNQKKFMGIIQGVAPNGKLEILLEDDSIASFNIKEVQMLY